ncbi:MAG: 50S ribosomal protein L2 [Candidatus Micrarchaeia archaeon]|jgi:large subunit ribosomal protein L2
MGTHITSQKRGHGSKSYSTPSFRYFADVNYPSREVSGTGQVEEFIDDPGRFPLLAKINMESGLSFYNIAAEGLGAGAKVKINVAPKGSDGESRQFEFSEISVGTIASLGDLPDGTPIFNIELLPFDGGKFARSSGAFASIVGHDEDTGMVEVKLPSKTTVRLDPRCRATVGVACGGGRLEKPLEKAGNHYYLAKARNRLFPKVRGTRMSAYDHPHGGRSLGKSNTVKRSTPPGRKVGLVAARRSGRGKGNKKREEGNAA